MERAYDSCAQKVRASVADSTDAVKAQKEAQLEALAAALGFADAAGKAGTAGAQAASDTAAGFDKAKSSIDDAAGAADNLATSATAAAAGITELGAGAATAGANVGSLASGLQGVALLAEEVHTRDQALLIPDAQELLQMEHIAAAALPLIDGTSLDLGRTDAVGQLMKPQEGTPYTATTRTRSTLAGRTCRRIIRSGWWIGGGD